MNKIGHDATNPETTSFQALVLAPTKGDSAEVAELTDSQLDQVSGGHGGGYRRG